MAAKGRADRLVSEAHAKNGNVPGEVADQIDADAGILRSAWARGEHDTLGLHGLDIGDSELVVAANLNLGAQFAKVLDEVISERIVVIEDEDHRVIVAVKKQVSERQVSRFQSFKVSRRKQKRSI